jgi:hypothetical protein
MKAITLSFLKKEEITMKKFSIYIGIMSLFLISTPASSQENANDFSEIEKYDMTEQGEIPILETVMPTAIVSRIKSVMEGRRSIAEGIEITASTTWRTRLACSLQRPGQVQRWHVRCEDATYLDGHIADFFMPGDHWKLMS